MEAFHGTFVSTSIRRVVALHESHVPRHDETLKDETLLQLNDARDESKRRLASNQVGLVLDTEGAEAAPMVASKGCTNRRDLDVAGATATPTRNSRGNANDMHKTNVLAFLYNEGAPVDHGGPTDECQCGSESKSLVDDNSLY